MPCYGVEGKLGTGKTKFGVWMAQQALYQGRRVAGNVDLVLEKLTPLRRSSYIRLPDHPTAWDLQAMGHGNPGSYDEDRNGVLLLDELGTWLNSRSFQDKSRAALIDWFLHARKHGWDVFFLVQSAAVIDKQVRETVIEYECRCMRMDKVRIPVIGRFLSAFYERAGYLPRFHLVTARIGYGAGQMVADRWIYKGSDLHGAYDTRQVFTAGYPHGPHTVLPPWDFQPPVGWLSRVRARAAAVVLPRPRPPLKPKAPEVLAIMDLPYDQRIAAWHRYFGAPSSALA